MQNKNGIRSKSAHLINANKNQKADKTETTKTTSKDRKEFMRTINMAMWKKEDYEFYNELSEDLDKNDYEEDEDHKKMKRNSIDCKISNQNQNVMCKCTDHCLI